MINYVLMFMMFVAGAVSAFVTVRAADRDENRVLRRQLRQARGRLQAAEAENRAMAKRLGLTSGYRSDAKSELGGKLFLDPTRLPYLPGVIDGLSDRKGGDDVLR